MNNIEKMGLFEITVVNVFKTTKYSAQLSLHYKNSSQIPQIGLRTVLYWSQTYLLCNDDNHYIE